MIRAAFLALLIAVAAPAQSTGQQARIENLENQLLAPCCWSETVAEHRSEIAFQMRDEIAQMVAAGRTDREILDHYKAQYGMRILVEPEGGLFWVMNIVPVAMLIVGTLAAILILRRWLKHQPSETAEEGI
jgi:cytochrome c-type biogenesis protein CcmH